MNDATTFGAELRRLRFGPSLFALSVQTGLSASDLHAIEEDRLVPDAATVERLIAAWGLWGATGAQARLRELAAQARGEARPA